MIKDIQVTVYDILGYFVPGLVFVFGSAILGWSIFAPTVPVSWPLMINDHWLIGAIAAYLCGHMAQAMANVFMGWLSPIEDVILTGKRANRLPEVFVNAVKSKASQTLGINATEIDTKLLYQVCAETVEQFGVTNDRDVYIYREGFYRGLMVSFPILAIALLIRGLIPGSSLILLGTIQRIDSILMITSSLVVFLFSWLSFNRYRRFGQYRVIQAIIGFHLLNRETLRKRAISKAQGG